MPGLKRKAIKQIIQKKLDDWLSTLPEELNNQVKDHLVVTGGCIASMLLGEPIKDFDIYCDDKKTTLLLAEHYVDQFNKERAVKSKKTSAPYVEVYRVNNEDRVGIFVKSSGAVGESTDETSYNYYEGEGADGEGAQEYIEQALNDQKTDSKQKYKPVFMSQNAISISNKIQLVIRFYGFPKEIHGNYDYVHATNYYWTNTKSLVLNTLALESLLSKTLIYTGSLYPICSLFRMRKFMDRGWSISAGEITKMAFQISELNLNDPKVLREQLTGVDYAYFIELIHMIDAWKKQNEHKSIDAAYVIQLIDKLAENDY
jgi:hypothetical protein